MFVEVTLVLSRGDEGVILAVETERQTQAEILNRLGEHFAAGYLEPEEASVVFRMACGLRNHLAHLELPEYRGDWLHPRGVTIWGGDESVIHHYVKLGYDQNTLDRKRAAAQTEEEHKALDAVETFGQSLPPAGGYTHSIPFYGRLLREGLDGYQARVFAGLRQAEERADLQRSDFYNALLIVLEGVAEFHRQVLESVQAARLEDPVSEARRKTLLAALAVVPFSPATTFFEALVGTHFLFTLDGCDDLGRFDQDLWDYYRADKEAGRSTREECLEWIKSLWQHVDECGAWNVALGGTTEEGHSAANELTILCLEAARHRRRPNLALRLREDTPEEVWDAALDTISTGCGLPALYCEENYLRSLREAHLGPPEKDLVHYAFGGCTETMIHGRSNVGSLDHIINLPKLLVEALHDHLTSCSSFEAFVEAYKDHTRRAVRRLVEEVNQWQETKARHYPQLIRSLLIDDCIENGREYADGGARYNWSVVNVEGLGNVIDSLCAVREVVFDQRELTGEALLKILSEDFADSEPLRKRLEKCPRYGNGHPTADAMAQEISRFVFHELMSYSPWRGGRFLPSCLMFVTYGVEGHCVGATPDGRRAGEPIADSAGAVQGRDRNGPTALLRSVAGLDQIHAPGTLVVNVRFSKKILRPENRQKVKDLIRTYFRLGGMQIQVNVVDQEILKDALAHPERHDDLIIRIGGYSEYFNNLSHELKVSVLERTEHE